MTSIDSYNISDYEKANTLSVLDEEHQLDKSETCYNLDCSSTGPTSSVSTNNTKKEKILTTNDHTSSPAAGKEPIFYNDRQDNHDDVDKNIVLGMERTLFAALNNAWLLAIGGVGLMSVGSGDERATQGGIAMLSSSILTAISAYTMHISRVSQLANGEPFHYWHTVLWAGVVSFLTLTALAMELNFGVLYPYLLREKAVTIVGEQEM